MPLKRKLDTTKPTSTNSIRQGLPDENADFAACYQISRHILLCANRFCIGSRDCPFPTGSSGFNQPLPGSTGFQVPQLNFIKDENEIILNHPTVQHQTSDNSVEKYNDASWNYGVDFPANLSIKAAITYMTISWTWAVTSGLFNNDRLRKIVEDKFNANRGHPRKFFSKNREKLTNSDFIEEGVSFINYYYEKRYFTDYANTLSGDIGFYEAPDS